MLRASRAQKQCCALLFVDVAAAYCTTIRELIFHTSLIESDLGPILNACGLPPSSFDLLQQRLHQLPSLEAARGYDPFTALLAETLRQSWLLASGASRVAVSFRGTRPGSPMADALFLFVIAEITNFIVHT